MEAFSLLKYWRAAAPGGGGNTTINTTSSAATTTILNPATPSSSSSSSSDSGNDDGPFFDLEFAVPDDEDDDESSDSDSDDRTESLENVAGDTAENDEAEVKLTISSTSAAAATAGIHEETAPKFPVASILKSASKFRVQMRKFNKPKSDSRQKEKVEDSGRQRRRENGKPGSKLLTVKLKVEEAVPLVSVLFSRDHNSSNKSSENTRKTGTGAATGMENITEDGEDERKFAKELMNKYLKKVKPLYVRASKRYGDKLRFSAPPPPPEDAEKQTPTPPEKATEEAAASGKVLKQGNIQAGLRVVCKHLGKSRSASSSTPPPPTSAAPGPETSSSRRRDDSLLQQQDGIQSAIMHCKRSLNASRDSGSSVLSRSVR